MSSEIRKVTGAAVPIRGNDIDTDRIIPARYLKEITFEKMGDYLFQDARFDADGHTCDHPLNDARYKAATMMVVQHNFGCGSSREHAPQSIFRYGIKALIGESFAEIFLGNCRSLGVPAVTASKEEISSLLDYIEAKPETELFLDLESKTLSYDETVLNIDVAPANHKAFLEGTWDALSMLKSSTDAIDRTGAHLPYFSNYQS